MAKQTVFLEDEAKSARNPQISLATEQTLRLPEASASRILTDRLFANDLREAEKTLLADRLVARAFINDAIALGLSPAKVHASMRYRGVAVRQARELIRRYYYSGENDPRGISNSDSNPGSVAGTYRNLYNEVLETLAISDPIQYSNQTEPEVPDRMMPARYKAFYEEARNIAPSTNSLVVQSMRNLITRYMPNVHQAEAAKDLMGQFNHLRNDARKQASGSRAKLKQ